MTNLSTERLLLNHPTVADADKLLSFYENNKEHFEPYEPKRPSNFYTLGYQRTSLLAEISKENLGCLLRFYIHLKSNPDTIIGTISISDLKLGAFCSCVVGYKMDYQYCHQGYAYEALIEVINHLISYYRIHRMEAYIMPTNTESIKLISRLGFLYDGVCTDYAMINGYWENHERYVYLTSY